MTTSEAISEDKGSSSGVAESGSGHTTTMSQGAFLSPTSIGTLQGKGNDGQSDEDWEDDEFSPNGDNEALAQIKRVIPMNYTRHPSFKSWRILAKVTSADNLLQSKLEQETGTDLWLSRTSTARSSQKIESKLLHDIVQNMETFVEGSVSAVETALSIFNILVWSCSISRLQEKYYHEYFHSQN